jgi:hypothetical protein
MPKPIAPAPIPQSAIDTSFGYGDPNIYKNNSLLAVTTASLPAASADMNGRVLAEHVNDTTCNLVFYKNGHRFKVAMSES